MTGGSRVRAGWPAWRVAARLASREGRRRPWRTLLVAALVALPVAGMTVAVVWIRTDHQSPLERWRVLYGTADLFATPGATAGRSVPPGGGPLEELLPPGSRSVTYRSEYERVLRTAAQRRALAEVTDLPMDDPLAAPIMQVTSGRAPREPGEAFLGRALARRLGVGAGDLLRLERPPLTLRVVGIGERRAWWGSETLVVAPGTPFPWRDSLLGSSARTTLVDLPAGVAASQLAALAQHSEGVGFAPGIAAGLPGSTVPDADDDKTRAVAWIWVVGAVALTVVGIVIAAAFAAGARRQLTTLGQLSANGAAPAVLRRVLFLQGTWTGTVGTALGLGAAAGVLAAVAPHADALLERDVDPYTVRLADLVPIAVLGIAAATVAALVPARTTARIPVLAALAGRRPLAPVPRWLTAAGVAVGGGGLALLGLAVLGANGATGAGSGQVWTLTAVVGGVAVLLGACAVAPGYVSVLEPLAARLRGSSRLAARSLARQRTRTGAVVSAVSATGALAIAAAALVLANDAKADGEPVRIRADEVHLQATTLAGPSAGTPVPTNAAVPAAFVDRLLEALPGARAHRIALVGPPGAPSSARWEVREFRADDGAAAAPWAVTLLSGPYPLSAAVATPALDELYDLPAAARDALGRDGIVALTDGPFGGHATAAVVADDSPGGPDQPPQLRDLTPPVDLRVVTAPDLPLGSVPRVLVTSAGAGQLGLEPQPDLVVIRAPRPLSADQRATVSDLTEEQRDLALDAAEAGAPLLTVSADLPYDPRRIPTGLVEGLLAGLSLLLSLFVVAVNLALAAAETRDERDVLAVVGAAPATMRRTSGHKAFLLTLLGTALAVPVGFLPVAVFTAASDNLPLVFPWRVAALLVAAVPILAAGATTLFSGLALRLRPVRVSTMAFE